MIIEIIKCSLPEYWYSDKIGIKFSVVERIGSVIVVDRYGFHIKENQQRIFIEDTKEREDLTERDTENWDLRAEDIESLIVRQFKRLSNDEREQVNRRLVALNPYNTTMDLVKAHISEYNLAVKSRNRQIAYNRFYLCAYLRSEGIILHDIGKCFNRDHSTVIWAIKQHKKLTKISNQYKFYTTFVRVAFPITKPIDYAN